MTSTVLSTPATVLPAPITVRTAGTRGEDSEVNMDNYSREPARLQGMVRGRTSLRSPRWTVNWGRHDHYRCGQRLIHRAGMA